MTARKITYALKKIEACKRGGHDLEALLKAYHLNIDLIRYILANSAEDHSLAKEKKLKLMVKEFYRTYSTDPGMSAVIPKGNFKAVRLWIGKTDRFFKVLKLRQPANVRNLMSETEKIFGILNISANKLFVNKPGTA